MVRTPHSSRQREGRATANRTFVEYQRVLLKNIVTLFPIVNVGAAGAVTLQKRTFAAAGAGAATPKYSTVAAPTSGTPYVFGDGFGVRSVTRNSTGNWTLVLTDPYLYLIQATVQFANSGAAYNAPVMIVDSNTTNTNVALSTAPGNGGKITVQFYNSSGSAADPGNGDQASFAILLGDSGAP